MTGLLNLDAVDDAAVGVAPFTGVVGEAPKLLRVAERVMSGHCQKESRGLAARLSDQAATLVWRNERRLFAGAVGPSPESAQTSRRMAQLKCELSSISWTTFGRHNTTTSRRQFRAADDFDTGRHRRFGLLTVGPGGGALLTQTGVAPGATLLKLIAPDGFAHPATDLIRITVVL